jgi:hypothetical protein
MSQGRWEHRNSFCALLSTDYLRKLLIDAKPVNHFVQRMMVSSRRIPPFRCCANRRRRYSHHRTPGEWHERIPDRSQSRNGAVCGDKPLSTGKPHKALPGFCASDSQGAPSGASRGAGCGEGANRITAVIAAISGEKRGNHHQLLGTEGTGGANDQRPIGRLRCVEHAHRRLSAYRYSLQCSPHRNFHVGRNPV